MRAFKERTTLLAMSLILLCSASAYAQVRGARVVFVPHAYYYRPFFYDPWWVPYPYAIYPYAVGTHGDVKLQVTPKQAEVYVDGFYAGLVDDFDGTFKHLQTTPGGHAITLHLEGYRTVTENIYVRPDETVKMKDTMEKLDPGETSAPPPLPARPLRSAPLRG
jgi:hypothetical protein